jgi:hypothetical protein
VLRVQLEKENQRPSSIANSLDTFAKREGHLKKFYKKSKDILTLRKQNLNLRKNFN